MHYLLILKENEIVEEMFADSNLESDCFYETDIEK